MNTKFILFFIFDFVVFSKDIFLNSSSLQGGDGSLNSPFYSLDEVYMLYSNTFMNENVTLILAYTAQTDYFSTKNSVLIQDSILQLKKFSFIKPKIN